MFAQVSVASVFCCFLSRRKCSTDYACNGLAYMHACESAYGNLDVTNEMDATDTWLCVSCSVHPFLACPCAQHANDSIFAISFPAVPSCHPTPSVQDLFGPVKSVILKLLLFPGVHMKRYS